MVLLFGFFRAFGPPHRAYGPPFPVPAYGLDSPKRFIHDTIRDQNELDRSFSRGTATVKIEKEELSELLSNKDCAFLSELLEDEWHHDGDFYDALSADSPEGGWVDEDSNIKISVNKFEIDEVSICFEAIATYTENTYGGCPDLPHSNKRTTFISGSIDVESGEIFFDREIP